MWTFLIQEFRDAFHLGSNLVKLLHSKHQCWDPSVLSKTKETVGKSPSWPHHPTEFDFREDMSPFSLPTCEHGCHPFFMLCFVCSPLPKALNNKSPELRLPREVKACQKQSKTPNCNVPQLVLVTFLWTTMQQGPTETNFKVKQISSSLPSSYAWHGTLPSQQLKKWTLRHRISK